MKTTFICIFGNYDFGNYVYIIIIFYIITYEVQGFIICMHPSSMQTLVEAAKNVLAVRLV
jgi:hypothetical protein